MKKIIAFIVIIFCSLIFAAGSRAHHQPNSNHNIRHAINLNWCGNTNRYCEAGRQAWNVASCETGRTFNVWAGYPGTYWGLFQMDSNARRNYGHGWSAWKQAKAAHAYWKVAGWRPWPTCGRSYY